MSGSTASMPSPTAYRFRINRRSTQARTRMTLFVNNVESGNLVLKTRDARTFIVNFTRGVSVEFGDTVQVTGDAHEGSDGRYSSPEMRLSHVVDKIIKTRILTESGRW